MVKRIRLEKCPRDLPAAASASDAVGVAPRDRKGINTRDAECPKVCCRFSAESAERRSREFVISGLALPCTRALNHAGCDLVLLRTRPDLRLHALTCFSRVFTKSSWSFPKQKLPSPCARTPSIRWTTPAKTMSQAMATLTATAARNGEPIANHAEDDQQNAPHDRQRHTHESQLLLPGAQNPELLPSP